MLVEKIGYIVETVSISGRTTAVMRQQLSRLMPHPPTENIGNRNLIIRYLKYPSPVSTSQKTHIYLTNRI